MQKSFSPHQISCKNQLLFSIFSNIYGNLCIYVICVNKQCNTPINTPVYIIPVFIIEDLDRCPIPGRWWWCTTGLFPAWIIFVTPVNFVVDDSGSDNCTRVRFCGSKSITAFCYSSSTPVYVSITFYQTKCVVIFHSCTHTNETF